MFQQAKFTRLFTCSRRVDEVFNVHVVGTLEAENMVSPTQKTKFGLVQMPPYFFPFFKKILLQYKPRLKSEPFKNQYQLHFFKAKLKIL